jgi:hypothetical protein
MISTSNLTNVTDLNSAFVKMCEIAKEDRPLKSVESK